MTGLGLLFSSGHAVDVVLAVIAAEFLYLSLRKRRFGRRPAMIDCVLAFAPGVFILLALRGALVGAGWMWIAAPLAASFPFHIADLIRRRL